MINTIVTGIYGRMGQRISNLIEESPDFKLVGATEAKNHEKLGEIYRGIQVTEDLRESIEKCDVVIDFTQPQATLYNCAVAHEFGKKIVIGTTGFTQEQLRTIKGLSREIPIVLSPNMSIGVNLLFQLVKEVTEILNSGYDIEIVETHHRYKKDAPSGTAKKLAEIIAEVKKLNKAKDLLYGREGFTGERTDTEIGIHAVRGGDVVGEHNVSFIGIGERIELLHKAHSRDTFAVGALKAAKFLMEKSDGLYDMQNVLKSD